MYLKKEDTKVTQKKTSIKLLKRNVMDGTKAL